MQALIANRAQSSRRLPGRRVTPAELVLGDLPAVSVDRGELHRIRLAPSGWRPGWDFAGKWSTAPRSLPRGTRVYGVLAEGTWASRIVVPPDHLARLADSVDMLDAAVLPVAGLTAGRVLIVGAAGGWGASPHNWPASTARPPTPTSTDRSDAPG